MKTNSFLSVLWTFLFILTLSFVSPTLSAAVVAEFQEGVNGYTGTEDTYVREAEPTVNFGGETGIRADGENMGGEEIAFFSWDLSSIPNNAVVQSAVITFEVFDTTTGSYEIKEMSGAWDQSNFEWNDLNTADIGSTVFASITAPPIGSLDVTLNASALTLIEDWISGAKVNNGFAVREDGSTTDGIVLHSSEHLTTTTRPKLTITYTTGGGMTAEFQNGTNGYSGTEDSYLRETSPTTNYGTELDLRADGVDQDPVTSTYGEVASVIQWDVGTIPSTATVTSASIVFNFTNSSSGTYSLFEQTGAWSEATVAWNDMSAGSTALGTVATGSFGITTINLNSTGIDLVQDWVDGSVSNNGIIIKTDGTNDGIAADSSEGGIISSRPKLIINYDNAGGSTTVDFQDSVLPDTNYAGTRDTFLEEANPTTNYGTNSDLKADGPSGTGVEQIPLISWDISSIPGNATVQSADISINVYNASTGDYHLYEVLTSWNETAETWNSFDTVNDIGTTVMGTLSSGSAGYNTYSLNAAGVALVQNWIDGSKTNNGFAVKSGGTTDSFRFNSRHVTGLSVRPKLSITYTTPGQTVDPVALSPLPGTYQDSVDVTLSTTTSGADIYYTLDGSDPTTSSTLYTGSFTLTTNTTVKTFAVKAGFSDSTITSGVYTIETDPMIPGSIDAPSIEDTILYNVAENTKFLYEGFDSNPPVQTGLTATIDPVRGAVIRGQVFQLDSSAQDPENAPPIPLKDAIVTILGHDDPAGPGYYGQTLTRDDGFYDMAVNGGGQLTINISKAGYLPSQRKVDVPWHDFAVVENMLLMEKDPNATVIDLSTITEATEARGSVVTDSDGTRQATVLFLPNTTAERVYADGTREDISNQITVHATEYTVGDNGPMAMPALLPGTSAYTYMVNFTVDEAESVGAPFVEFSQPVYGYVENFLDLKAGQVVPNGYYDRVQGKWVPEDNGLVVKIISIDTTGTTPIAELDLDGDNFHDSVDDNLEITYNLSTEELEKLASLYQAGDSMWRVPMEHFSDWNYPIAVVLDAIQDVSAEEGETVNENTPPVCDICEGSTIQVQGQIYGEEVAVPGTPFTLHYNSDRVRGTKTGATLDIPLIDSRLDVATSSILRIHLTVDIAGKRETFLYDKEPNQIPDIAADLVHRFEWDGLDAYGREVVGVAGAKITIGYEYPTAPYGAPAQFATPSPSLQLVASNGTSSVLSRTNVIFSQSYIKQVNVNDFRPLGLGGWTVDANHVYEFFGPGLHLGPGPRRNTKTLNPVITTAIDLHPIFPIAHPERIKLDEEGNIFQISTTTCRLLKIEPNGTVTSLMGVTNPGCQVGVVDNIPAVNAPLHGPTGLDVDSEGNIYILVTNFGVNPKFPVVYKIDTAGIVHRIAGGNEAGFSGDGGSAVEAKIDPGQNGDLVVDNEGNVYIADTNNNRIRKIDTAGNITTVAGDGNGSGNLSNAALGDGGPSLDFILDRPKILEVDQQGNLYVVPLGLARIIKFDTSGIATVVAGNNSNPSLAELEGVKGTDISFVSITALTLDKDGTIYFANTMDTHGAIVQLRRMNKQGIVTLLNSRNVNCNGPGEGPFQENEPLGKACMENWDLEFGPDGNIYTSARHSHLILKIASSLPEFTAGELALPSEDGTQVFKFDTTGRHIETKNALTGATIFTFNYDASGRLIQITDGDGDVTDFVRNTEGDLTKIVAEDGQETLIEYDANGYLNKITLPETAEIYQMQYTTDGLMTQFTNPRGLSSGITYTPLGQMDKETLPGPEGGSLQTVRTENPEGINGYEVSATTEEGRVSTFRVETEVNGDTIRTNTDPNGLETITTELTDDSVVTETPDGTMVTVTKTPDERFGMLAPLTSLKVETPGTPTSTPLTSEIIATRATTVDANDVLTAQTDTLDINSRTFTSAFTRTTGGTPTEFKFVDTSPETRTSTSFIDTQGRIVEQQIPGIFNTEFNYDSRGRLSTVTQGDGTPTVNRVSTIEYYDSIANPGDPADMDGFIKSITDPLMRVVSFKYDANGRVKEQTLPDMRIIKFEYDLNGNVEKITTPKLDEHGFMYNSVDQEKQYDPPGLTLPTPETKFEYNDDKQLDKIIRPDTDVIDLKYDSGGRLEKVEIPGKEWDCTTPCEFVYDYFPNTEMTQAGNLQTITTPAGDTLTFTYDGSLLKTSTWGGTGALVTGSVERDYDNDFRITSRKVDTAHEATFTYDDDSLLKTAKAETEDRTLSLKYDIEDPNNPGTFFKNGLLRGTTMRDDSTDDGVVDSYLYNEFGEVKNYKAEYHPGGGAAAIPLLEIEYVRDKLGRIEEKKETIGTTSSPRLEYEYDLAGRLHIINNIENISSPIELNDYVYDDNGNRLAEVDGPNIATYDAQDRLEDYNGTTYDYTDNGELMSKVNVSGTTEYTYDVLGNLIKVDPPGTGNEIEYIIDGRNRRIGKKVNTQLVKGWLYKDGLNPIAELDGNGAVVSRFIYASKSNVPDFMVKNGVVYRIISDHLVSPRLVVDISNGNIAQRLDYDEWGNILPSSTNIDFQPFAFAGGLYDTDTELLRFGARDYDPYIGRWISKDPIRFASGDTNFYNYSLLDPVNFQDPTGKVVDIIADAGFIAYDLYRILADNIIGDCTNLNTNLEALGADTAGFFAPGLTGLGAIIRTAKTTKRVTAISKAESIFWRNLKPHKGKTKSNGKTGKRKRLYEWDHTHGEIEVYDRNGKHLGALDPISGKMTKGPEPGRTIDP